MEKTKEKWGRESVELSDKIKTQYQRIKDSETVNIARSSSQIVANKVRVYMADLGMGNGPRLIQNEAIVGDVDIPLGSSVLIDQ